MQHEMLGPRARFERYAADMLYWIAAGKHIDPDRSPRFSDLIDDVYRNPFKKKKTEKMTAEDIKQHLLQRIRETRMRLEAEENNGSDDISRKDRS